MSTHNPSCINQILFCSSRSLHKRPLLFSPTPATILWSLDASTSQAPVRSCSRTGALGLCSVLPTDGLPSLTIYSTFHPVGPMCLRLESGDSLVLSPTSDPLNFD